MYFFKFLIAFIILITFISCYNNSLETLNPDGTNNCDTLNVTYSGTISKIIENNCNSCHGATYKTKGASIRLDNYNDLKNNFSIVLGAVNYLDGYERMPKNKAKLSNCNLLQLQIWKNNNMPNN